MVTCSLRYLSQFSLFHVIFNSTQHNSLYHVSMFLMWQNYYLTSFLLSLLSNFKYLPVFVQVNVLWNSLLSMYPFTLLSSPQGCMGFEKIELELGFMTCGEFVQACLLLCRLTRTIAVLVRVSVEAVVEGLPSASLPCASSSTSHSRHSLHSSAPIHVLEVVCLSLSAVLWLFASVELSIRTGCLMVLLDLHIFFSRRGRCALTTCKRGAEDQGRREGGSLAEAATERGNEPVCLLASAESISRRTRSSKPAR